MAKTKQKTKQNKTRVKRIFETSFVVFFFFACNGILSENTELKILQILLSVCETPVQRIVMVVYSLKEPLL